jgi:hypothetical protein
MYLEDSEIKMLLAAVCGALAGTMVAVLFFLFVGV